MYTSSTQGDVEVHNGGAMLLVTTESMAWDGFMRWYPSRLLSVFRKVSHVKYTN